MKKFLVIIGVISEFLCASKEISIITSAEKCGNINFEFELSNDFLSKNVSVNIDKGVTVNKLLLKKHLSKTALQETDLDYKIHNKSHCRDVLSAVIICDSVAEQDYGRELLSAIFSKKNIFVNRTSFNVEKKDVEDPVIIHAILDNAIYQELNTKYKVRIQHIKVTKDGTTDETTDGLTKTFRIIFSRPSTMWKWYVVETIYPI